ncbi:hypothetical protein [Neptuniibacter sp.]|uniref:hypothetical protein n=1 Tax=Neptuniibacter sp. TaxID=1962643 RepID=UPI0026121D4F|nr:hypothetical protein [Neptuniibacter sp.]MCP4596238.1 hypothetical protein [Neptuniibacter sp.]
MITQGDWITTKASDAGHHAVQVEHGQFICEFDPLPEAEDNAALVAAAPRLLAACRNVQNARDRAEPYGGMIFQQALDNVEAVVGLVKNIK